MNEHQFILKSGVKLIGLYGHAGSGKDTVADLLTDTYKNHYSHAFADPLKAACSVAFGIPVDDFHNQEKKEELNPNWSMTPRTIAQFMGTEIFRDEVSKIVGIGEDFWIKRMFLRLNNDFIPDDEAAYEEGDTVVISDVRFQNEYDWIVGNNGVIIHLTRPGADGNIGIPGHASEQKLNLHSNERTYSCKNDGTISDLHRNIANIIVSATQF